jgi:IS605 OrfB family transposase
MRLVYKFNYYKKNTILDSLSEISNNLYNQALYIVRKELQDNHKWIRYYDLNKIMMIIPNLEGEINYRKLKAQIAQQILKLVDKNFTSYFKSIKDWSKNKFKYKGMPKLPNFHKPKSKNIIIYTNQDSRIRNNKIYLNRDFYINIPKVDINFSKFQQIRILPKNNYYEIEIIYNKDEINMNLNQNNYLSIDLGINNLATCISQDNSFIFSGKLIKSINQYFNKQQSKLKSIRDRKGVISNNKKFRELSFYRNNFIKDQFHKITRLIINYCITKNIGTIVCGYNNDWKDSIQIGKVNNQKFTAIPHRMFLDFLKYKCTLIGINCVIHEESYTSKCDSLALEPIEKHEEYLGKRIKRGLFQSSIGKLINADVNGAVNVLRKVIGDGNEFIQNLINSVVLFNPVKIRFDDLINKQTLSNLLLNVTN